MANKKFKNGNTLDSSCILHNEQNLSDVLDNGITQIFYTNTLTIQPSADEAGYLQFTLTVPSDYIAVFVGYYTYGQISALDGLQVTCCECAYINGTGAEREIYCTYYAPNNITKQQKIQLQYLGIKKSL